MIKNLIIILLLLIFHSHCDYTTYDGSKLISLSYYPNDYYDATEEVSIDNFSQEMISYYSWFASYGNCQDIDIPDFCCQEYTDFFTKTWKIISKSAIENYYKYNFIFFRNDEYKKYIITFPGTRDPIFELLNEAANTQLVNYNEIDNGIQVVSYFYNVMKELKDIIFTSEVLSDINNHSGYQFISIGHSLGGAVATLVLYDAVNRGYINPNNNEPVLITFGQPRTGNENFVLDFNTKIKNVLRIARDGDMVTAVPYSLINNQYRHIGGLILLNKEMDTMIYCPKDIGEDYPDKECEITKSLNFQLHTNYFNPDTIISTRCRYEPINNSDEN